MSVSGGVGGGDLGDATSPHSCSYGMGKFMEGQCGEGMDWVWSRKEGMVGENLRCVSQEQMENEER